MPGRDFAMGLNMKLGKVHARQLGYDTGVVKKYFISAIGAIAAANAIQPDQQKGNYSYRRRKILHTGNGFAFDQQY